MYITLPRYLIFTIPRNTAVKRSFEFMEEIDLRKYTKESANAETKYTLCALLVFSEDQTYFPVVKCKHENKWLTFDKTGSYECNNQVLKNVKDGAVLLVYSRHSENGSAASAQIIQSN